MASINRNHLINVGLVITSLMVGAVMVEIGLRILDFSYPAWEERDSDLGFIGLPGAEGWWTHEGRGHVKMNDDGVRDRNHALAKPKGTRRIAFFGDSFVQAREVNREQGFVHLVEKKLASCADPSINEVEVFNFGFGGYNTAQALMMMQKKALKYRPGIVVLGFFVGNDVTDNVKTLNNFYGDNDDLNVPYLFFNGDGELAFDMSFRDRPAFRRKLNSPFHRTAVRMINRFATLQFLNFVRQRWRGFLPSPAPDAEQSWKINPSLLPPTSEAMEEAWKIAEAAIVLMRDEAREAGADFWLVTISTAEQIHQPSTGKPFVESDYPQRRLEALGRREGFPVVTLLEPFRDQYRKTGRYLHGFPNAILGDVHFNILGHQVAGTVIAERLCEAALKG